VAAWPGRTARADHVSEVLDLLVHKGITALDQVSPASP
jgi:hypothetical protein